MFAPQIIHTPVLVLVGPTAIGKTALSLAMAERFGCEIISMDSMQVYRFMDIGTAKASSDEQARIRHHLIDIVNPDNQYDAARFVHDCLVTVADISARGKIPLITGGTGLYLAALLNGLFQEINVPDAVRAQVRRELEERGRDALYQELASVDAASSVRIHVNDTQRLLRGLEIFRATGIPWSVHIRNQQQSEPQVRFDRLWQIGLTCERALLYDRIKERTLQMMSDAFEEEVKELIARGYSPELPSMQSIGYRHMVGCLQGRWDRSAATTALIQDTRHYAKRQFTWFTRSQDIHWYDIAQPDTVLTELHDFLNSPV